MKIDRLETHDRLLEYNKQSDYISKGCTECIKNRPLEYEHYPFYIFAHARTIEMDERLSLFSEDYQKFSFDPLYVRKFYQFKDVPTTRMLWSPRLRKPLAQENSMLFKAYPPSDNIRVIWIIPQKELWDQYSKDKMTGSSVITESIYNFLHKRNILEEDEKDDLSEERVRAINAEIGRNFKLKSGAASLIL